MKPAVLFVHSNSELYGADFILLEVVRALKETIRPIVAVPGDGPLPDKLRQEGVEVLYTRESILRRVNFKPTRLPGFLWNVYRDVRNLVQLIRRERVQLVYSNTGAVITGALAARICQIKNVFHIHEIILNPKWLAKGIARLVLGNSDEVIAVSGPVRDQLLHYNKAGDPPVNVIFNGLDPQRFKGETEPAKLRVELGVGQKDVLFGVIGRIHPWKGQKYFVEAAHLVSEICPEAKFLIVGGTFKGYEYLVDELHARVKHLDLQDRMNILSHRDDVPQLMQALDVFVLPSTLPDPLPTVVLEAMASQRPVIATAHGGALEMVVHGETGLLTPHNNVTGFAETLLELAQNKDRRLSMGKAGRKRLETLFSRQRFHDDIRASICRLLPDAAPDISELILDSHNIEKKEADVRS
ncbi:glycosyltransferase family 4 protein [bacterium]|nr:glycosyltransferase family 4 protein [bacterium]MBU1881627.1 glycosyltransferase family 4 protein [bacterium]